MGKSKSEAGPPSENKTWLKLKKAGRAKHTLAEADALYDLASRVAERSPDLVAVDIGTWQGLTAAAMALAGLTVYTVDPYEQAQERDLEVPMGSPTVALDTWDKLGVIDVVHPHIGFSVDLAGRWDRGPVVGLLFVDGSHFADAVEADVRAWRPHMAPGAFMAFHDYPHNRGARWARQRGVAAGIRAAGLHGMESWRIDKLKVIRLP